MTDEYATLRAAFHAGATIQAYTIYPEYVNEPYYAKGGEMPINILPLGSGYWRDLDGEPKFSCHPTRYRVKPEDAS